MRRAWAAAAVLACAAVSVGVARDALFDSTPPRAATPPGSEGADRASAPPPAPSLVGASRPATATRPSAASAEVTHAVRVEDEEGGPIAGVSLWSCGQSVGTTGADGTARVVVNPECEMIEAVARGFRVGWEDVREGDSPCVIRLERGAVLEGRVVEEGTGKPVAKARVRSGKHGDADGNHYVRAHQVAETDHEGRFRLEALRDEDERIWVEAPGWSRARASIRVTDDRRVEPAELVLEVRPAGWLSAKVARPDGTPAAGAVLLVQPEGLDDRWPVVCTFTPTLGYYRFHPSILVATVDELGSAMVPGLPFGTRFIVVVLDQSGADVDTPATILATPEAPEISLSRRLRAPATVHVRATGIEAGAETWLSVEVDGQDGDHGIWSIQGATSFKASRIVPGRRTIEVHATGSLPVTFEAELGEGETLVRDIAFERRAPGLELAGEVVDGHGAALEGVWVDAISAESGVAAGLGKTDAHGAFRIGGVSAGAYDVKVAERGLRLPWVPVVLEGVRPPRQDLRIVLLAKPEVVARFVAPEGAAFPRGLHRYEWVGGSPNMSDDVAGPSVRWVLHEGNARIGVHADGWALWEKDGAAKAGEVLDLGEIVLDAGRELRGNVVDAEGRPVAGARVRVDHLHGPRSVAGSDGTFVLPHVRSTGAYVVVEADGFLREEVTVYAARLAESLRIPLRRGGLLRVRVLGAKGGPGAGYQVDVDPYAERTYENSSWMQTDMEGHAHERLPAGRYALRVRRASDNNESPVLAETEVTLVEGGEHPLEIRLP